MARRKSKGTSDSGPDEGDSVENTLEEMPLSETAEVMLDGVEEILLPDEGVFEGETAYVEPPADDPYPYEYRSEPRLQGRVKAIVQFRESDENTWKEIIEIHTISKNGASLLLTRECPVGRLISLALQMPRELRAYDLYSDVYPMLAVVQNCSPTTMNDKNVYQVGVAFIGKKMPDSFKTNPTQSYRIVGMSELGLWDVKEAARTFVNRKSTRFWRTFEVGISIRDENTRTTKRQTAMSRDVSLGGMSVWGPLEARIGDRVKINSKEHDFFGMAVVRNRTEHADPSKTMIHFAFDGTEFPIARIRDPRPHDVTPTAAPVGAESTGGVSETTDSFEDGDGTEVVKF